MNTTTRTIGAIAVLLASHVLSAGFASAQVPAPEKVKLIGEVSRGADERLAKSIAELNALREQIAAEKLPLSQELTTLEERVTNLRKENDRVSRLVAAGALDLASVKA